MKSDSQGWHYCDKKGCEYKSNYSMSMIRRHKAGVHNIGVVWHDCPECEYRGKEKNTLRVLRISVHGTVLVFPCVEPNYSFKTEQKHVRTKHSTNVHGFFKKRAPYFATKRAPSAKLSYDARRDAPTRKNTSVWAT